MSRPIRKLIAVLLAIWLPLFGGSALAATVSMQAPHGACHEAAMPEMSHDMGAAHQPHHDGFSAAQQPSHDQADNSCNACGVCHLVCSGYLAVPDSASVAAQATARLVTPYQVSFCSITTPPLVPPPLARA